MTKTIKTCKNCGKPKPNKKIFQQVVILCHEKGWHVLDRRVGPTRCRCDLERPEIVVRLARVRHQRSQVKRRMVLTLKLARKHKSSSWNDLKRISKSKSFLLNRKSGGSKEKKSLQRQMVFEDLVLWGGREEPGKAPWLLFDTSGKPHRLEDVLDSPFVRKMIKSWPDKSVTGLGKLLSMLVRDPDLLSELDRDKALTRLEEVKSIDSDVENSWRKRLNDNLDDDDLLFPSENLDESLVDANLDGYFWPDELPSKK